MTEQDILDNAPEGTTNYQICTDGIDVCYLKIGEKLWFHDNKSWGEIDKILGSQPVHLLSDIKRIAELEAQLKAAQPEWISVENRMPQMFEPCIFAINLKGYPDYKVIGTIDESGNINDLLGDDIGYTSDSIDKWMPAPPEKKA